MSETLPSIGQLDYPIDPLTIAHKNVAENYATYLSTTYEQNAINRQEQWRHHFDQMHARYNDHIMTVLETGVPRSEMNIGIIGPGNKPSKRDFGETGVQAILPQVDKIVCADFSSTVIANAIEDLQGIRGIASNSIFPLMYDFTTGLSTGYHRFIQNNFSDISTFSQLSDVTQRIDQIDIEDFKDMIIECLAGVDLELLDQEDTKFTSLEATVHGNRNDTRTLQLTTNNEPIDMHSWFLPMVIAGTGAASEGDVWQAFIDTIDSEESTENAYEKRAEVLGRIHDMIAKYNTLAATEIIATILQDNPTSSVLAVTDVDTTHDAYRSEGALPRLFSEHMRKRLKELGILMKTACENWKWKDEPSHHHGVKAFTFTKAQSKLSA